MTGALILARSVSSISHRGRRYLESVLEHASAPQASVRREVEREIKRVSAEIRQLPARAQAEAGASFERMQARMRAEVAALPDELPPAGAVWGAVDRMRRTWLAELRRFAADVVRRHESLERDARALGARLGTLPARAVDITIAAPQPVPPADARGLYGTLQEQYGRDGADRIANLLDSVRQGHMGADSAKLAIAHIIDMPKHRAELIMRQEIGRAAQAENQEQMERLGERVQGIAKEWSSALLRSTRIGHREAHGQIVAADEPYLVRPDLESPYERLMYPKDPSGSIGNTANCTCHSLPRVDAVSLRPSQALS